MPARSAFTACSEVSSVDNVDHRHRRFQSISDLFESRTPSSFSVSTARGCESGLKNAVFGGQEDFYTFHSVVKLSPRIAVGGAWLVQRQG
ncbi:hypothetical protein CROQUDRAFT_90598 [Cronartium quercuum f. sp. fusiforme G11]|uniref:Uncharacterized protein n=1 Tax=Cronartium quercuum f. sp. fusiforme G11 TaxID=708437 RepID=A0A9P6NQ98_9BASI|nr:hypothetical protein CROQUDRAFT_90598 [Cronartium quercuum f. sp. fusiforme G11]